MVLALVLGLAWVTHAAPGYGPPHPPPTSGYGPPATVFRGGPGPLLDVGHGPIGGGPGLDFGGGPGPVLGGGPGLALGGGPGPIVGGKLALDSCRNGEVLRADGVCQQPLVTRKVFVYTAPQQPKRYRPPPQVPQPRVNTNVLFIRTPEQEKPPHPIVVPPPRQKNIVYVLDKRREQQQQLIRVPAGPQEKPEVYFVHYKDGENPILKDGTDLRTALGAAGIDAHNLEEHDDLDDYGGTQIRPVNKVDDIGDLSNLGGVGGIGVIGDPTGISGGYGGASVISGGKGGHGGFSGGFGSISGGYSNNVPDITLIGDDISDGGYGGGKVIVDDLY